MALLEAAVVRPGVELPEQASHGKSSESLLLLVRPTREPIHRKFCRRATSNVVHAPEVRFLRATFHACWTKYGSLARGRRGLSHVTLIGASHSDKAVHRWPW